MFRKILWKGLPLRANSRLVVLSLDPAGKILVISLSPSALPPRVLITIILMREYIYKNY
jgi:hypothetical protein